MSRSVGSSFYILLIVFLVMPFPGSSRPLKRSVSSVKAEGRLRNLKNVMLGWEHLGKICFDSLSIHAEKRLIQIYFSTPLSYVPVREADVQNLENTVRKSLGRRFKKYHFTLYSDHHLVRDLVPNKLRSVIPVDDNRLSAKSSGRIPVVTQIGKTKPVSGLFNNNLAVW